MRSFGSLFVEVDNGLGASAGDVDDGFAVAALLAAEVEIAALASTFGNVDEATAARNNRSLADVFGRTLLHLRGAVRRGQAAAEAADWLGAATRPVTVLALGPMTTVAAALQRGRPPIRELVLVGGDATSRGRWPPLWPYEFNLRCDPAAALCVLRSDIPITVVPLDVGRRLWLHRSRLRDLPAPFGSFARRHAERWFRRSRWRFRRDAIRLYDLLAAAVILCPAALRFVAATATMHDHGWLQFGSGGRPVRVVRDFDDRVLELLAPSPAVASLLP